MPIIQHFKDLDNLFLETENKIIINDLPIDSIEDLVNNTFVVYDKKLDMVPKCLCGELRGMYLKGEYCNKCGTKVMDRFRDLKPLFWIRKFKDDLPFLSPYVWGMFNQLMGKEDYMRWLTDTTYNPKQPPAFLHTIAAVIGGRGYKNVIENLELIIDVLKNNSKFNKPDKQLDLKILADLIKNHKSEIFSDYIPVLDKNFFIKEKVNKEIFTSDLLGDVNNIVTLAIITANKSKVTDKRYEITTAKIISYTSNLFNKYVRENLSGKKKLVRKHIYGARAHFTARAVITAISGKHQYDELHIPWIIAVELLRPHLINKLTKRGYNYRVASEKVFAAETTYDKEIDEIFQELIKESPEGGIPVLFQRNPSLLQSSSLYLRITKIKTDLQDNTISLSTMVVKLPNGDYDGDAMNLILLIDNKMADLAKTLEPHYGIINLDYFKINGLLYIPSTILPTVASYLTSETEEVKDDPVAKKLLELDKQH